jgi:hypothetical protein
MKDAAHHLTHVQKKVLRSIRKEQDQLHNQTPVNNTSSPAIQRNGELQTVDKK